MKYIWVIIVLVLVGAVLWFAKQDTQKQINTDATDFPPSATTLAGPQEPLPIDTHTPKTALPKHRLIVKDNMKIEVTTEGTGEAIINNQTAIVEYVGKLTDGTIFDASKKHGQPFGFILGTGQVIKGWDEGVLGMKVGETRILTIPSDLAYGPAGIPGVIPPNATLIFEVTLVAIK